MTAAFSYTSRRRSLTVTWARNRHPPPPTGALAGTTATLDPMPRADGRLTFKERAQTANAARQEAISADERQELARRAAAAANSPLVLLTRTLKRWKALSDEERAAQLPEIRRRLRDAGIIR